MACSGYFCKSSTEGDHSHTYVESEQRHQKTIINTSGAVHPHTDLFGEILDDAVLGHLGADGKASLQLLLNARDHLLVLLGREPLHSWIEKCSWNDVENV